ncbi:MAG TPA: ATP-binding protein, partial [Saprospiraceae bacterium]|nr:ATP-binding protein [Saprospiraceae bacterium]
SRADLADLAEALEVVGSRSRALMDFVQAYRSFSAIPEPKPESIPARRLLDHIVQLFNANQRSDQAIRIEAFVAPEELVIEADAGQIEMVLLNLVKNAREALQSTEQPDKRITLRAGNDDKGKAFIEVDDNGPGIAPDLLDEIFIPFFTTKTSGTGVGLSISRQIMQLHGGNIRVSSTLGSGTRFVLAF